MDSQTDPQMDFQTPSLGPATQHHPDLSCSAVAVQTLLLHPAAGRGVVALAPLPAHTLVHATRGPPAAHVVFRAYRKEVCALCFRYDRGRTLPFRAAEPPADTRAGAGAGAGEGADAGAGTDAGVGTGAGVAGGAAAAAATGKVFCSAACAAAWASELGGVGVAACVALEAFVRGAKSRVSAAATDLPLPKPELAEIDAAWRRAGDAGSGKKGKGVRMGKGLAAQVDPDVLGFLLSGVLLHYLQPERWRTELCALAMDPTPYRDQLELQAHCDAFRQLVAVLPEELRESVTPEVCRVVVSAAGHNAFGIRAGGDDNEEYMGYAVYPSASYFNHSCRPNIGKLRVGRSWEFRALGDIVVAGEECCITYLGGDERDMTVQERRRRLEEVWGFVCQCQRCREEANDLT